MTACWIKVMFVVCVLNSAEYGSSSLFYSSVTAQLLPESLRLLLDLYSHLFFFLLVNRLKAAVCNSWSWEVFFAVVFSVWFFDYWNKLQKCSCDGFKDGSSFLALHRKEGLILNSLSRDSTISSQYKFYLVAGNIQRYMSCLTWDTIYSLVGREH